MRYLSIIFMQFEVLLMRFNPSHKLLFSFLSIFLACFFGMSVLCACGNGPNNGTTAYIVFTDALGRTVSLSSQPQRTACLLGSFADVWTLAGGDVCAAAEDAWDDFGLDLPDAVNIGGAHSPNTELLLSAAPDFVIASSSTASHVELCPLLEASGITVAYFDVICFDDYLQMLKTCTDITGRTDLWEQNGERLAAEITSVKQQYADAEIPISENRILLLRASSGFVKAKGSNGTVLGEMLADLGCRNIADSDASLLENLSIESVIAQEPYHIFVITMGSDTDAAMQSLSELFSQNPAWQSMDAVQNNRIHIMDKSLFHLKPNARWAEAYQTLYEILTDPNT